MYGSVRDFLVLGSAGLIGSLVDVTANFEFNLCLTDFSRLLEMGYFAWYYWDSWRASGDESETVKAIIYTIQAWRVGFNLRCYQYAHKILTQAPKQRLQDSHYINRPLWIFNQLSVDLTSI